MIFQRQKRTQDGWLRLSLGRRIEPGHGYLYRGLIRRDTFTVFGFGLVVMRLRRRPTFVAGPDGSVEAKS